MWWGPAGGTVENGQEPVGLGGDEGVDMGTVMGVLGRIVSGFEHRGQFYMVHINFIFLTSRSGSS